MTAPLFMRCNERLAALSWGETEAPTWLALHGWLDNAASFTRLAPRLASQLQVRIVAIDFAGHGLSNWFPPNIDYAVWDYCHDVLDTLEALKLERCALMGHSLGAGVATLMAAAMPERVSRLVLIDGLGALATEAKDTARQLRQGLTGQRRRSKGVPSYTDMDSAIAARVKGGVTPIDADTARPLVERNAEMLEDGGVRPRTDSRLLRPSPVRFCPEQVLALLSAIQAPTLLVEASHGVLTHRDAAKAAREAIPGLTRRVLEGGHHLHLEVGVVDQVADVIATWWRKQG